MTTLAYFRQWTRPGVLATLVVAFMTYMIEIEVANLETKRAAVSRSVALYRDFVSSNAVMELRGVHHQINQLIWSDKRKAGLKSREGDDKNRYVTVFRKKSIQRQKKNIRESLVGMLLRVDIIYNCGNFHELFEDFHGNKITSESLCDRRTISTLLGGVLVDLFFSFRAVLYCDKFFLDNYFLGGNATGYVSRLESLVMHYLYQDMHESGRDKSFGIFRKNTERLEAIAKGDYKLEALNYTVLRATQERCHFYPER